MVSVGGYAACRVQYSTSSRLLNANKTGVTRLSLWLPRTYASRKLASKTGFGPASGLRWRHLSWAGIRKKQFQSIRTSPEERHPSSNAVTRHGNRCHFIPDTGRELIHHFDKCHCSGPPDWSSVTNLFHVTACAGAFPWHGKHRAPSLRTANSTGTARCLYCALVSPKSVTQPFSRQVRHAFSAYGLSPRKYAGC